MLGRLCRCLGQGLWLGAWVVLTGPVAAHAGLSRGFGATNSGFGGAAWLGLRHWQSKGCFDLEIGSDEYFDCACDLIRLTKRRLSEQGELSLRLSAFNQPVWSKNPKSLPAQ